MLFKIIQHTLYPTPEKYLFSVEKFILTSYSDSARSFTHLNFWHSKSININETFELVTLLFQYYKNTLNMLPQVFCMEIELFANLLPLPLIIHSFIPTHPYLWKSPSNCTSSCSFSHSAFSQTLRPSKMTVLSNSPEKKWSKWGKATSSKELSKKVRPSSTERQVWMRIWEDWFR